MKKIIVVLCFILLFFTACRSKDPSLENVDKVDVAVSNGSILNFKRGESTVTESKEVLKIIKLVSSLNLKKEIDMKEYLGLTGANSYYIRMYSKKKLIREYIIYGEFVTIKNDGEEIVYLVSNEDKLKTYINVLVENSSLSKHNKTTSSNIDS
jgi:hypothetical protein